MKKRFLENAPLFAVLSDDERQSLAEQFALRQFAEGMPLFREGEPAEAMVLVKSGMVRLVEGERSLGSFGPSSLLGEVDLLLNRPHSTTAIAQGVVDAWLLTRQGLAEAMRAHPAISIKLSTFFGERIVDVDQYLIERLRHLSILAELDEGAFRALAEALVLRDVRQGGLIFQSGAAADYLYFVESGTVTIVSSAADDPSPFRQLGPGELFGHEALLRNRPYGAVARAATNVQLWELSRAAFEELTTSYPSLRQMLAAHLREHGVTPADREAALDAMARVPLFASLPPELLELLVSRMTLRHAATNETIYTAGDPGDAFYLVDRGVIKLLDDATLVERREDGEWFGEMALLTGHPRPLTARAARPTNLWALAKRDFDAIAVRYPELTTAVSLVMAEQLAAGSEADADGASLAMFPLFTGLTPKEQADLARRFRTMRVGPEEVIFRRGAVADAFYLVRQGQVKLLNEQGLFDLVRAGGFFGEMALLTGNAHSFSAQAVEESELLLLDRAQFEGMVRRYSSVSLVLSRALSARLEAADARGTLAPPREMAPHRLAPAAARPSEMMRPAPLPPTRVMEATAPPPTWQDRAAPLKLVLVLLPLLWLIGVTAPTMLLNAAAEDESAALHPLMMIGASPTVAPSATIAPSATPLPTLTPPPTNTVEASATPAPSATPRPTSTPRPASSATPES